MDISGLFGKFGPVVAACVVVGAGYAEMRTSLVSTQAQVDDQQKKLDEMAPAVARIDERTRLLLEGLGIKERK